MKNQTPKTKILPSAQKVQSNPKPKLSAKKTVTSIKKQQETGPIKASRMKSNQGPKEKPDSVDSLAVYMRNDDKRSNWSDIANAAEKKYGKIDVSKFDIMKQRGISSASSAAARKKYNLKNK